jgi:hypothetical protein
MNKYPITQENKKNEETTIKTILNNNSYSLNTIRQKQNPEKKNKEKNKWATFPFFGPETRIITKLFKNTEIGISYRTRNDIKQLLRITENKGKYNQVEYTNYNAQIAQRNI